MSDKRIKLYATQKVKVRFPNYDEFDESDDSEYNVSEFEIIKKLRDGYLVLDLKRNHEFQISSNYFDNAIEFKIL